MSSIWSYFRRSVPNYNVKCLCLTLNCKENAGERQFVICADSCFQSTGLQKDDVIHQRGRKFSEKHERRNKYENNRQQNTLFELRRLHVPVLDA